MARARTVASRIRGSRQMNRNHLLKGTRPRPRAQRTAAGGHRPRSRRRSALPAAWWRCRLGSRPAQSTRRAGRSTSNFPLVSTGTTLLTPGPEADVAAVGADRHPGRAAAVGLGADTGDADPLGGPRHAVMQRTRQPCRYALHQVRLGTLGMAQPGMAKEPRRVRLIAIAQASKHLRGHVLLWPAPAAQGQVGRFLCSVPKIVRDLK
jgi:hypothetical protein